MERAATEGMLELALEGPWPLGERDAVSSTSRARRFSGPSRAGDGGDTKRCQRGDPVRRVAGEAERPHPAQRGVDFATLRRQLLVVALGKLVERVGVSQVDPGLLRGDRERLAGYRPPAPQGMIVAFILDLES